MNCPYSGENAMRTERDFLGTKELPDSAYYGINTARALDNFGSGAEKNDKLFIKSYLLVKKACALVNQELKYLNNDKANAIISAIDVLLEKDSFEDICVNPLSGGAGTSLNMNINEVIANHALSMAGMQKGEYSFIHPLDDVNMHQSTNDTYPTALKTAILMYLGIMEKSLVSLQESLQVKELEFAGVVKLGRTEMQDALPMTVGMQFSAYSEAIGRDRWRIFKSMERIKTVNLGGTAIGTGFNAPQDYIFKAADKLKQLTGLNISRAENLVDATQNLDSISEVAGMVKTVAVNLMKISEDFRILSSGPEGGIGEFILPALQEGSTIMPGKVNPVMCEYITQSSLQVFANDHALCLACAMGNLELNQLYPLAANLILKNLRLVEDSISKLDHKIVRGLKLNEAKITENISSAMAVLTYLSQHIGHDKAAAAYEQHKKTGKPVRDVLAESKVLDGSKYDELMTAAKIRMVGFRK